MDCDELYISFLFPPAESVSGITVFKRIVENNKMVDVLQSQIKSPRHNELDNLIDDYVSDRILVDVGCNNDWADCIFKSVKEGMKSIKGDYKKIYSRSWLMSNHFLAYEYKMNHPEVYWTAEFSDPLIFNLDNEPKTYREMIIDDESYISKVNKEIINLNEDTGYDFKLIESGSTAYFIAEYFVYLFADKIIFTNENQRKVMLDQFPVDVKSFVLDKSEIEMHPTLNDEFYHIKDVDLDLDENHINMAYFGNDYYSKRHFESLFYAVEALNHKYGDRIRVYLYLSNRNMVKSLIPSERFIVKKPLEYLDFLNATTKFDVLIVNDLATNGNFEVNPYLPSKLSDYLGSGSDIWALYEKESTLSGFDLKYKSDMADYNDCLETLVKILKDYGYVDDSYSTDYNYLNNRFTYLNELYEKEYKNKNDLKRKVKKIKKENKEIKSSSAWKISRSIKKLKN
ncbi:hypothetical protein [Methanobrevibacter sp.]|uniref:hypothetical protein n=1 Tax=Methanobrevibacter sp. TaxID=66852 RepID=UPI00386F4B5E